MSDYEGAGSTTTAGAFTLQGAGPDSLDAARYRYLRNIAGQVHGDDDGPMVCAGMGDAFDFLRGEDVDRAVDAAMESYRRGEMPEGYMERLTELVRNAPRLPDDDMSNDPPPLV